MDLNKFLAAIIASGFLAWSGVVWSGLADVKDYWNTINSEISTIKAEISHLHEDINRLQSYHRQNSTKRPSDAQFSESKP